MLKLKYILFVYLIISKVHLQTQYVLMFTFIANYYLKITIKALSNTHTHSSMQTNKKCIRLLSFYASAQTQQFSCIQLISY